MKSAPSDRVRVPARPFWLLPSLLGGFALAGFAPVVSAQTQAVSEIQVTPETMTLGVGQKQALFAAAFDGRGNLLAAAKFTFWSSDTMIARVRKDGTVLGITPGLAKIEARTQGKRASMAVLITGVAPGDTSGARSASASLLSLEPASVTLFPGENVRITPLAVKEDGNPIAVGRVTWRSLKPEIASVDTAGYVTGLGPGRTVVQVSTTSRLMATLPVEVSQPDFALSQTRLVLGPGESDTVRVIVPAQGNREIRGLVRWRSSDSAVVSVGSSGIIRGRATGKAEIIATGFSQERRAQVFVHPQPDALVVSPQHSAGPVQLPLRATRRFTAVAEAADSTSIPEAHINWQLSDTSVASFDRASGVLTPKALGTTTLTATLAGIQPAVWTVQVISGDIELQPARVGLAAGRRTTLNAVLKDEQGAAAGRATGVRWSSDKPEVAVSRDGGVIDAVSPGRAVITAAGSWGKSAKADVLVVGDLLLSSNRGGSFAVYQMRVTGPLTLMPLLTDSASGQTSKSDIQASLSPDRTRIAFSSNRGGNFDIYMMDADGQHLRRLTTDPRNEGDPVWTPDGTQVVYTTTRGSASQIAIMPADGGEGRILTTTPAANHSPTVSSDGRSIAFVSSRDGNQEIYAMNLDGSNQRRLTRTSERESSPRFFRNGDLAYVVERGGRSKGSRVMRLPWGASSASLLLQTEEPVQAIAISREGDRLAYVVGKITDAAKGRVEFGFFLQSTAPGSTSVSVPLTAGEQILNPSF
ncbi:MAG TPA: Ig-like domain-containing protein [Gemmatimonadales bacterium]|nr:Ig-like domain-containing protein [Gemmatimonadales bacterium]